MKPSLRGIGDHWGTTEKANFEPKNCSVRVSIDIGNGEEEGTTYYYVQVVTPAYLSSSRQPIWGKSLLVVQNFSWDEIESAVDGLLSRVNADTWEEVVKILTRYFDWEYEGMEDSRGKILIPFAGEMNPRANQ